MMMAVCSTAVNVPLVFFLLRDPKSRKDDVSTVMRSLAVSDFGVSTILPIFNTVLVLIPPSDIPDGLITFVRSIQHIVIFNSVCHLAAMLAIKCYIIVRPLTYSTVLTARFKCVLLAAIWTGNCVMIVGADLFGVRWVLNPLFHLSTPVGNLGA